jgi:hypothetical protein
MFTFACTSFRRNGVSRKARSRASFGPLAQDGRDLLRVEFLLSNNSATSASTLSACSRSVCRALSMHRLRAAANRRMILIEPTPSHIDMRREPSSPRNGTAAVPVIQRARWVLPLPGGPLSNTPVTGCPPISRRRAGSSSSDTHWRATFTSSGCPQ